MRSKQPKPNPETVRLLAKYLAPETVATMANTLIYRLNRGDVAAGDVAAVQAAAVVLAEVLVDLESS